ncbi:MAG TPA: KUP/HAK/KT family potassium transporter, partial [Variovorax sp.]|nr:KUP/HAK/KT family potassium transporter [Variovorax sp.]
MTSSLPASASPSSNDPHAAGAHPHARAGVGVTVAALGVVFGDIGTSVLYAFKETLNPEHGVGFSPDAVLGPLPS